MSGSKLLILTDCACVEGILGGVELAACRAASRTDCVFPFTITYTEQKSGAVLFIKVGTS